MQSSVGFYQNCLLGKKKYSQFVITTVNSIKTECIRKLSNFNFQGTKTLYQNNLNNIALFFTFLKAYTIMYLATCKNTKRKFLMGA